MSAFPVVTSEPDDVDDVLARYGLPSSDQLKDAVLYGAIGRAQCSANDPPSYPGTTHWALTTRALRSICIPDGWEKNDRGNYSRLVSPNGAASIVVATGDEATGRLHGDPKSKCPKGPFTVEAVGSNRAQLNLFDQQESRDVVQLTQERTVEPQCLTWILLVFADGEDVRAEISLPLTIGDDDRIETWRERVLLDMRGGGADGAAKTLPDEPEDDGLDVEVVRRAV